LRYLIILLISLTWLTALTVGCSTAQDQMPKVMPDDFAFSIQYGVGSKNLIDSFKGVAVKDLISAGTAEAKINFTQEELQRIYDQMAKINILGALDLTQASNCRVEPHGVDIWHIQINGVEKTFQWSGEYCDTTKDIQKLRDLRNFIVDIVKAKNEYQALPDAEGAYE